MKKVSSISVCWLLILCLCSSVMWPCQVKSVKASVSEGNFNLEVTADAENNCFKLSWDKADSTNTYDYTVYTKDAREDEYQKNSTKTSIKVLEIRPGQYSYLRNRLGATKTYNGVTITSDSITLDAFNSLSEVIYKYDVVVFGISDNYGGRSHDMTENAVETVKDYISQGYGVLFTHDTLSASQTNKFSNFLELCNNTGSAYNKSNYVAGSKAYVSKTGTVTSFPYDLGEVGTSVSISKTHSTYGLRPLENVWMKFCSATNTNVFNSYFSTYHNCGLIAAGHSTPLSNGDGMVIFNALYYLAQYRVNTSYEECIQGDQETPNTPVLNSVESLSEFNAIKINTFAVDNGSTYDFCVSATNTETGETLTSNTVSKCLTTGVKGYSIVVDQNADTQPDDVIDTYSGEYTVPLDSSLNLQNPIYIHVKAIDVAGNVSETLHATYNYCATYVVSFETNGACMGIEPISVLAGEAVTEPEEPVKTGYKFVGWYLDEECTQQYDFSSPVTSNLTLYAKWSNTPVLCFASNIVTAKQNDVTIPIHTFAKGFATNSEDYQDLYNDSELKGAAENGQVTLTTAGVYTFEIVDDNGDAYYLLVNYSITENSTCVNLNELINEINAAKYLYNTIPDETQELEAGAMYVSAESHATFWSAIEDAVRSANAIVDEEDVSNAVASLRAAEFVFRDAVEFYNIHFLTVVGDTIYAKPASGDSYALNAVYYNVDSEGNLKQGIWKNWNLFKEEGYEVKTSNFVWEDVPDGVYTMLVKQKNTITNTNKGYFEVAIVANETDPVILVRNFVQKLYDEAVSLLADIKTESTAQIGESYVSTIAYNRLSNRKKVMGTLLDSSYASIDNMISEAYSIEEATRLFKNEIQIMDADSYSAVIPALSIIVSGSNVLIYRSNLYSASIAKGEYDNWTAFKNAGYTSYTVVDGAVELELIEIGVYTVFAKYKDGTCEYVQFEIESVQENPSEEETLSISLTESDGVIHITTTEETDIAYTGFAYGDYTDSSLIYNEFVGFEESIDAVGKGIHTIYVEDFNGNKCYQTINVTSVTEPVVKVTDSEVIAYTNGFDIETAAYAQGTYSDWENMQGSAIYFAQNCGLSRSSFTQGTYTFYFKETDGTEHFSTVELS